MYRTSGSLPRRPMRTSLAMSEVREVDENAWARMSSGGAEHTRAFALLTREGARRAARAVERENIESDRTRTELGRELERDDWTRQPRPYCHSARYVTEVSQRVDYSETPIARGSVHLDPPCSLLLRSLLVLYTIFLCFIHHVSPQICTEY